MKLRLLTIITAILGLCFCLSTGWADESGLEGKISVVGKMYDVNGNKAKFYEYSDDASGKLLGNVKVKYDSPGYFLRFLATDIGYDTQHYRLDGGAYGKFKYWFDYNEIVHNITFDAKTFLNGAGSDTLTGAVNTNPDTWANSFDYSTERKKVGTGLSFLMARPFFFNVSYFHEKKEGITPIGVGTSPLFTTWPSLELPNPIDYRTTGFKAEGGYAKNPFFLSFSYFFSEFRNGSEDLSFTNPVNGATDLVGLPPDNKFYKFALKGSVKLPMKSRFTLDLGDARTKSDAAIFTTFDGKIDTRNYDFQFASNPLPFIDGRVYYKYYERDNKSTGQIIVDGSPVTTNPLYYQTDSYGIDLGLKLPAKLYLNGGYKYVATDRRIRFQTDPAAVLPYNRDNSLFAELKWTGLPMMTAKVGWEGLSRDARYRTAESRAVLNRQFAYADQDRDTFKAAVDLFPSDDLNLGLEYRFKRTNYDRTAFGFTDDTRNAVGFTADYALKKVAKLSGYFDYEKAILNQNALVSNSFWDSEQKEKTYGYGLRADLYTIPKKLTFILQYDYLKANGSNDFGFYDNLIFGTIGVPAGLPVDISNWDDYKKYTARLTAVYNWSDSLSLRAGYAYARYDYSDAQLNNYQYVVDGSPTNQAFLTGANSRPSYSANIVFLGLTYRFK